MATSAEEYLAACPEESRAALEDLRQVIRAIVPEASEVISYGMPTFRVHGRMLVSYAAFSDHCSLFPLGGKVIEDHASWWPRNSQAVLASTLPKAIAEPVRPASRRVAEVTRPMRECRLGHAPDGGDHARLRDVADTTQPLL